ncbi:MAG: metallophosphoesterase [Actinomycetota bacterium]
MQKPAPESRVIGLLRAGAAGVAVLGAYSFYEPYRFKLASIDVPVARPVPSLTVLHLSDLHLTAGRRALARWLEELPRKLGQRPDLVAVTGDLIEDGSGIEAAIRVLSGLEGSLGRFYVLGSHDYYESAGPSYSKYFTGTRTIRRARRADTASLEAGLEGAGWVPLTNATELIDSPGGRIRISGVDDPYISRHSTEHISRAADEVLALGLMHAPDVVSDFALHGFDLVLAGHTHAGQVRLPRFGALVTNCSLPAGLAGGLHRVGATWLHVSPGLGTSRYSPVRFLARPEATLLRLAGDGTH